VVVEAAGDFAAAGILLVAVEETESTCGTRAQSGDQHDRHHDR
jgi:hypothetical protein